MPTNNLFSVSITAADGSNHLYLGTSAPQNVMTLTLTNIADSDVSFPQYNSGSYTIGDLPATMSALYLVFNGLLDSTEIAAITFDTGGKWTPQLCSDNQNGSYWVLLPGSTITVQQDEALNITVKFPALTGSAISGYFSCYYDNAAAYSSSFSNGAQVYVALVYPRRSDGSAPALLPIQFEVIKGSPITRDSATHDLSFRITNTSGDTLLPAGTPTNGITPPKFTLSFIQDNDNAQGSLVTDSVAQHMTMGTPQLYGNALRIDAAPQQLTSTRTLYAWAITEDSRLSNANGTILGTGTAASITFTVSGITTHSPVNSVTMAVLEYSGFPGYEDGQVTAEIYIESPPVADPIISSFTVSPSVLNIVNVGTTQVSITAKVYGAKQLTVWQGLSTPMNVSNPVDGNIYVEYATMRTTTPFVLTVTNSAGKTITRTLTVQVDTVPIGTIAMWSGDQRSVPSGWTICDGRAQGVPDLRERFIIAASGDHTFGATQSVTDPNGHYVGDTAEGDTHYHAITTNSRGINTNTDGQHSHTLVFNKTKDVEYDNSGSSNSYYHGDGSESTDNDSQTSLHYHSLTIPSLSGTTDSQKAGLPPLYALYFIIKMS